MEGNTSQQSTGAISRFFRPKSAVAMKNGCIGQPKQAPAAEGESTLHRNLAQKGDEADQNQAIASGDPIVDHGVDGWQWPAGLTAEAAIEIGDEDDRHIESNDAPYEQQCADVAANKNVESRNVPIEHVIDGVECAGNGPDETLTNNPRESKIYINHTISVEVSGNIEANDNREIGAQCASTHESDETYPSNVQLEEMAKLNPFEAFAFTESSGGTLSTYSRKMTSTSTTKSKNNVGGGRKRPLSITSSSIDSESKVGKKRSTSKPECKEFIPVEELPESQRDKIRKKWQSLADPSAPLEVRRFQLLIAARLHARAQEPVVKAAMDRLRKHFEKDGERQVGTARASENTNEDKGLCARTLSTSDPERIAAVIKTVNFPNAKARHIIQEGKEVCTRFGGTVPQTRHGLMELTGIGKKLADILAFVNSTKAWCNED